MQLRAQGSRPHLVAGDLEQVDLDQVAQRRDRHVFGARSDGSPETGPMLSIVWNIQATTTVSGTELCAHPASASCSAYQTADRDQGTRGNGTPRSDSKIGALPITTKNSTSPRPEISIAAPRARRQAAPAASGPGARPEPAPLASVAVGARRGRSEPRRDAHQRERERRDAEQPTTRARVRAWAQQPERRQRRERAGSGPPA